MVEETEPHVRLLGAVPQPSLSEEGTAVRRKRERERETSCARMLSSDHPLV